MNSNFPVPFESLVVHIISIGYRNRETFKRGMKTQGISCCKLLAGRL